MSSTVVTHEPTPITTSVDDLLVLWQHPDDRSLLPIGRFRFDGQVYSFDYTKTAARIEGFRTLPGLHEIGRHHESEHLFPAFRNRVVTPGRPDYTSYLHTLGLDANELSPWEQIVRSGGDREGDTLQFVQVPTVRDGHLDTRFLAHGVRHIPEVTRTLGGQLTTIDARQHEEALSGLAAGDPLLQLPESGNPVSEFATVVATVDGIPLGYVPDVFVEGLRRLIQDQSPALTVQRINPPNVPSHMRLALRLQCSVPDGFTFDPDGAWEPAE